MTYGITPAGFTRKPESVIVEGFEQRQLAKVAADLDVSAESIVGQFNGIYGAELALAWEQLDILARANDPDQAEDDLLEQICKLTGTEKRSASYSTVDLTCALAIGTTLEVGVAYAAVLDDPSSTWTPVADFTAPSTGSHLVQFRASTTGPVTANAGTITVIHSPVAGWSSVTNANDADPGRPLDTNATLRLRREQRIASTGSASTRAIRAAVLAVAGVQTCRVFENTTAAVNIDGLPPHSVEVLIYDGDGSDAENAEVAQAILDAKAGGIETFGGVTANATDENGDLYPVSFSRATLLPVYVSLTVETVASEYVSDPALAAYLVARAQALYSMSDIVRVRQLDSVAFEVSGVVDVTAFTLGYSASPVGTANLAVGLREIATFDTSRVVVTS